MFEIIALIKPVQLKESSVSDAIDTPNANIIEFRKKKNLPREVKYKPNQV